MANCHSFPSFGFYATRQNRANNQKAGMTDPLKGLTIRFRLEESSSEPDWSKCNMYEFAEECGLIILLKNDQMDGNEDPLQYIWTRRWRSLITWLRRLNDNLRVTYEKDKKDLQNVKKLDHGNSLLKRLPVKILKYDTNRTSFIKKTVVVSRFGRPGKKT